MNKEQIWNFFEHPKTNIEYAVRYLFIILILISSTVAFILLIDLVNLNGYANLILQIELFILAVFSLEFFLRLYACPSKKEFLLDKYTWIDALAIFPFYFGFQDLVFLRVFRLLRIIRLIKNTPIADFFAVRNTFISRVTPVVLLFVIIKAIIFSLEYKHIWMGLEGLDVLFTILGFSLGIVISNKIVTTYSKYIGLRGSLAILHGKLINLSANINMMAREKNMGKQGIQIIYDWLKEFLSILKGGDEGGVRKLRVMNRTMYNKAASIGNTDLIPFHRFSAMMAGLYEHSVAVVSRRTLYTPAQYDKLILQLIVMYVLMLCVFVPGVKGLISVTFATYLLYGLHILAIEFDFANGNENPRSLKLITLNTDRLERYLGDLEREIKESRVL